MTEHSHRELVAEQIEAHMRETPTGWDRSTQQPRFHLVERDGAELHFGTILIRVGEIEVSPPKALGRHEDWIAHVNIDFILNEELPQTTIGDCATGMGDSAEEALREAARWWFLASAPTAFSLLAMGPILNAQFYSAQDDEGVPGWEAFSGPYLWKGGTGAIRQLQAFVRTHPLLYELVPYLPAEFERPQLNTIKLYYGWSGRQHFASCMVNGQEVPAAQAALLAMGWPPLEGYASISQFILLIARPADL